MLQSRMHVLESRFLPQYAARLPPPEAYNDLFNIKGPGYTQVGPWACWLYPGTAIFFAGQLAGSVTSKNGLKYVPVLRKVTLDSRF